jgi:hypothetical protein
MSHKRDVSNNILVTARYLAGQNQPHQPSVELKDLAALFGVKAPDA